MTPRPRKAQPGTATAAARVSDVNARLERLELAVGQIGEAILGIARHPNRPDAMALIGAWQTEYAVRQDALETRRKDAP
ncbi:MAG: hypothetical protein QOG15_3759 [Solirubrobacteraceae bacterium]|jgi:hypothetical protein|nr:hypothetical protein [Solirubrobacteraceae bacterium]